MYYAFCYDNIIIGSTITQNVDVACPGQEVELHCKARGNLLRWSVMNDRISFTNQDIDFHRSDPLQGRSVRISSLNINADFYLVAKLDGRLVSDVNFNASYALHDTRFTCSGYTGSSVTVIVTSKFVNKITL